jgi:single-strand DNA-binding protein
MVNKVILIGRLGKDPEIKTFENGNSIANFSLATNETYKDRTGEKQDRTDWHNIQVGIPGLVKLVQQYFKKGDVMYLEGKLRTREYEKEGQKRYVTEVQAESIRFLPKNSGAPQDGSNATSPSHANEASAEDFIASDSPFNDDLPF